MLVPVRTTPLVIHSRKKKKKIVKHCTQVDKYEGRYLFLDSTREILTRRRLQDAAWYSTNASNQKYVPYYNLRYTAFTTSTPITLPSHPRQRHRCDYHVSDIIMSFFDKKASRYGCFIQALRCFQSNVGQEPERLRDEYWIDE